MGLLRKAATTATRGDTDITPPPAPVPEPFSATHGLLKKSITLQTSEKPASSAGTALPMEPSAPLTVELAPPPAGNTEAVFTIEELAPAEPVIEEVSAAPPKPTVDEIITEVVSSLQSLPKSVELPARLFTEIASRLSVQKGALLLYDPMRLVYAPWASKGYDQTTLHRLRIPLGANDSWNALANGVPITVVETQSLASYQQFFSSREFGSVSRILLTPFIADEKLIAVLLFTDIASPFESDNALLQCLSRIAETGSPLIHAARSAQLAETGDLAPRPDSQRDEMSRFVSSFNPSIKSVVLLSLSTDEYAKSVIASHEHLDPFRLHEDMRYFLGSFLTDIGGAMSVRQGLFIVGLSDFDPIDVDLFLHQLTLFFHGLFGGNGRAGVQAGPRMTKHLSWPADGGDMRGLIESLSG